MKFQEGIVFGEKVWFCIEANRPKKPPEQGNEWVQGKTGQWYQRKANKTKKQEPETWSDLRPPEIIDEFDTPGINEFGSKAHKMLVNMPTEDKKLVKRLQISPMLGTIPDNDNVYGKAYPKSGYIAVSMHDDAGTPLPDEQIKYTIAHEIGHLVFDKLSEGDKKNYQDEEKFCDDYADKVLGKTTTDYESSDTNTPKTLVDKINKHSWVPIKEEEFASKLIGERMSEENLQSPLWNNLSTDMSSTDLFDKPLVDPTLPIVMVDINFLSESKGNELSEDESFKSVKKIMDLVQSGTKLSSVPGFDVKKGVVDEGNHRVEALKRLGYKSCPVQLWGGWD